jgi:hypothetical protein
MLNRNSSLYSGKTKNSSMISCGSVQSLCSKTSSPQVHSVSTYNISTPDKVIEDLKNELKEKDKTIVIFKKRIQELLSSNPEKNLQSSENLHKLIKKGDSKLEKLKLKIEIITKENENLMTKQQELLGLVSKYRKENIELKSIISNRKTSDFTELESKLKEVETMQADLIKENIFLREKANEDKISIDEMLDVKFSVVSSEIYKAKIEISQILKVCRIIKSGKELDLSMLLNHRKEEEKFTSNSYKLCNSLIVCIRKDIEEIKDIISDMKAEYYGSHCTTQ